jgi:hypothetical protein
MRACRSAARAKGFIISFQMISVLGGIKLHKKEGRLGLSKRKAPCYPIIQTRMHCSERTAEATSVVAKRFIQITFASSSEKQMSYPKCGKTRIDALCAVPSFTRFTTNVFVFSRSVVSKYQNLPGPRFLPGPAQDCLFMAAALLSSGRKI